MSFLGFNKPQDRAIADIASGEDHIASELVDHARAFQRLSVADVMTPRVDIVAIELSVDPGRRPSTAASKANIRACRSTATASMTRSASSTSRTSPRTAVRAVVHDHVGPAAAHAGGAHPHGPGDRRIRRHRWPRHPGRPDRGGGRQYRRRI
ncbi:MAG: hypothetical protein WDN06_07520 [Asticcacaulis sp.]